MSQQRTGAVLFDIGNVVLRSTHAITYAILADFDVRPDKWKMFFHQNAYGEFARGQITGEQFAQATREALEAPQLTDVLVRTAHDAHVYAADAEVHGILRDLHNAHVPLAFVTTTNAWQTEREREFVRPGIFGDIARSHRMGVTKTDPDAWPMILKLLRLQDQDPSTMLLVDDSTANCAAAREAGLMTHLYDPTPIVGVHALRRALVKRGILT